MVASKIVEGKTDFSGGKYMYFDYKRGEIQPNAMVGKRITFRDPFLQSRCYE
jgi:hypothetical protein